MAYTLKEIASFVDARLDGDATCLIEKVTTLVSGKQGSVAFLANSRYQNQLETTKASAVLVSPELASICPVSALIVDDPYLAFAKLTHLFSPICDVEPKVHPSAVIADDAQVSKKAEIGANVVIEAGAQVASGCYIGAGSFIGKNSRIGEDCRLWANVTVYHGVSIGERVTLHSGAVIGADGFGFANDQGRWQKIAQLGGVTIGDDVEVGANTCIDRGAIEDTVIGNNVILDNLIQIAHNVSVGDGSAMAAKVGIAGSSQVGKNCMISGAAGILGHLQVADGTQISAMSLVTGNIRKPGVYSSGTSLDEHTRWKKNSVRFKQLDQMSRRLAQVEKKLAD